MKTQITLTEGREINHNQGGLKTLNQSMSAQPPLSAKNIRLFLGLPIAAMVVIAAVIALNIGGTTSSATQSMPQPYVKSMERLPFGPGWAANYGTNAGSKASSQRLPFGPGWAASYGTQPSHVLPFGPGWAATYGVPAR